MRRKIDIGPGEQILYIGSYACTRHRANELAELQQREQLAYLCLDEVDFITGDYLQKINDAAIELAKKRNAEGILLQPGCQCALLSTDFTLITQELSEALLIPVRVHDTCRLCGDGERRDHGQDHFRGERRERNSLTEGRRHNRHGYREKRRESE